MVRKRATPDTPTAENKPKSRLVDPAEGCAIPERRLHAIRDAAAARVAERRELVAADAALSALRARASARRLVCPRSGLLDGIVISDDDDSDGGARQDTVSDVPVYSRTSSSLHVPYRSPAEQSVPPGSVGTVREISPTVTPADVMRAPDAIERAVAPAARAPSSSSAPEAAVARAVGSTAPPPLSSSSSSSSTAPPARPRAQFFFLKEAKRSFTREQLVEWMTDCKRRALAVDESDARNKSVLYALAPAFTETSVLCDITDSPDEMFESALQCRQLIVDVSRTNGDTTCALLHDKYKQPCILSANGRSYSKDMLEPAVQAFLAAGNPLRLDDGDVMPETADLQWWPNLSLGGWDDSGFRYTSVTACTHFGPAAAQRNDIAAFSDWLDQIIQDRDEVWDTSLMVVYQRYKERRPDAPKAVSYECPPLFRDLEVVRVPFPRARPKHPACFRNVLFTKCVVFYSQFSGPRFYGCKFDRCDVYIGDIHKSGWWLSCEFVNCTFYWPPGAPRLGVPCALLEHDGKSEHSVYFRVAAKTLTAEHMRTESVGQLLARLEAGKTA